MTDVRKIIASRDARMRAAISPRAPNSPSRKSKPLFAAYQPRPCDGLRQAAGGRERELAQISETMVEGRRLQRPGAHRQDCGARPRVLHRPRLRDRTADRDQGRKRPSGALRLSRRRRALRRPGVTLPRRAGAGDRILHRCLASASRVDLYRQARQPNLQSARSLVTVFDKRPHRRLSGDGRRSFRNAGIRAELYLGNPKHKASASSSNMPTRRASPCADHSGIGNEKAKGEVTIKDLRLGAQLAGDDEDRAASAGASAGAANGAASAACRRKSGKFWRARRRRNRPPERS